MGDHNGNVTGGYLFTSIAAELHGIHGGSRAVLSQEAGAGATGHMAALELPHARRRELVPRDAC
jgi:hypothetical protein